MVQYRPRAATWQFFVGSAIKSPHQPGASLEAPYWHPQLDPLLETGRVFAMDTRQDPRRQLDWLLRIQPDYLLSQPANLEFLAGLLRESGQRLTTLRVIQTVEETLTEQTRKRIEQGFGVPVKNIYSCTEVGTLASTCPEGHGLHVHCENVLLETLNDQDQPCGPGETGRVVLTTLQNHLTPLDPLRIAGRRHPGSRTLPLRSRTASADRCAGSPTSARSCAGRPLARFDQDDHSRRSPELLLSASDRAARRRSRSSSAWCPIGIGTKTAPRVWCKRCGSTLARLYAWTSSWLTESRWLPRARSAISSVNWNNRGNAIARTWGGAARNRAVSARSELTARGPTRPMAQGWPKTRPRWGGGGGTGAEDHNWSPLSGVSDALK